MNLALYQDAEAVERRREPRKPSSCLESDWRSLDLAHKKLDAAVSAAYGWPADLSDDQILERLLALNLERAAEEANAVQVKKPKTSRAKREDEML